MSTPGTEHGHEHGEAYCHMLYRADDNAKQEWLWNSRDGVTPYVITLPTGKSARHVDWWRDRYDPNHVPDEGERVFVDLNPERALELATAQVERDWDRPDYPMRDHPYFEGDKRTAAQKLVEGWFTIEPPDGGEAIRIAPPDVVEVNEVLREEFARRAEERRS